jgi:predicted enzyme related to lactoylglutathione lyase
MVRTSARFPRPQQRNDRSVCYWHVDDIEQTRQGLLDAGAEAQQEIKDVGSGKLVASVKDADENVVGLIKLA